jgi:subtilisin family serine protease
VHRVSGAAKIIGALGCVGLLVAATAPAIASATVAPPIPGPSALPAPIASATAANRAGDVYEESASTTGARVPIVTVETTSNGPKIVAHQVTSESQARAVATDAARGNDLIVVQPDSVVHPIGGPTNDQYSANQWSLTKTTFTTAWAKTRGKNVTVAVIDTGVDANHPDLAGQLVPGKAFLSFTANGVALNPRVDSCGHGTHVAGTIAAVRGNGVGVTGVAPEVKIMPIKVLDKLLDCGGYSSDVAAGITWAANNGARVINLSLGGTTRDQVQDIAITYARSKGVTVVAAAGNSGNCTVGGTNPTSYPGASAGVIGVAAVNQSLTRACFSNRGSYVDLSAPGVSILATYPTAKTPAGYAPYMYMDGTSMAAPHVAAAAALILSRWPTCTPDRVQNRLQVNAKHLGSGTGRNSEYGYGLIDPAKSVASTAATC